MILVDINCDLGEGIGNEDLLMPLISSCNIACGGHAGDEATMSFVADLAQKFEVKIGAHPSFPDRENFGRKEMNMSDELLYNAIYNQIRSLKSILDQKHISLHHVKPHGALYNKASVNKEIAQVVVSVIKDIDKNLILYAPYKSVIADIASQVGLQVRFEAFADRNYNQDLTLVSRRKENALIHDAEIMFEQVSQIVLNEKVTAINGVEVVLKADTFCVHGDGKNVVQNLEHLIHRLKQNNIEIS
ncbi:5-oxoprolinase subunit PxpA [Psychroserpens luteolus]|uniref:5-oxoprolinase subunit PxpA n=1 Tax=Psychroserpens luteolus TaxID=2855840 RepID=UPI001E4DE721|nr:5-oxoprolinase subunit PxpA [Psychroserpens luteolus]MCD2259115.1 5-oxoprolinase subunit PxpA [Psychroserpens luteolus]